MIKQSRKMRITEKEAEYHVTVKMRFAEFETMSLLAREGALVNELEKALPPAPQGWERVYATKNRNTICYDSWHGVLDGTIIEFLRRKGRRAEQIEKEA